MERGRAGATTVTAEGCSLLLSMVVAVEAAGKNVLCDGIPSVL